MGDQRDRCGERLRRRREYLAVQRRGQKIPLRHFLAFVLPNDGPRRVGITVSGKVGNAVRRNRVKRRLRESWRQVKHMFPDGYDVVLVAKRSAVEAQLEAVVRQLEQLAHRLSKLRAGDQR